MADSSPDPSPSDAELHCPSCGHNLTAVTSKRCPECGEQFVVTNAKGYLATFPPSKIKKVCNAVWAIGTILIVLSWFRAVPSAVGWVGFGISLVAWLVALAANRKRSNEISS